MFAEVFDVYSICGTLFVCGRREGFSICSEMQIRGFMDLIIYHATKDAPTPSSVETSELQNPIYAPFPYSAYNE